MAAAPKKIGGDEITEMASLKHWGEPPQDSDHEPGPETAVDCGWGRLIFGQTYREPERLADTLQHETKDTRDVAFYVRDPHVVLAQAPQDLFLDPSHTFRLDLTADAEPPAEYPGFAIREARRSDEEAINALYHSHDMVPMAEGYLGSQRQPGCVTVLVAEARDSGEVIGAVMGVDHAEAFEDPDMGSSLWALAVDSQKGLPGVGQALALALADLFRRAGRSFMDLSVMHDNEQAIGLYEKLGFVQVPVYAIKKKNPINEPLFIGPAPEEELNIYAKIIVDEARRRGIAVAIEDAESGLFRLSIGGRSIACRESLSDMTSAVAMSRCDDKSLTWRLLKGAGLNVPAQIKITAADQAGDFLKEHKRVVVKPARGEQGQGVYVDLRSVNAVKRAVESAQEICDDVIVEEFVVGQDLRVIVINNEVVAAALRRPASITGDGKRTIGDLIKKQSRRREAATGGESCIPMDAETKRSVEKAGYGMEDVLPAGETLAVRSTANLHTGGTIHDVTAKLHKTLAEASLIAAETLEIPVVGLDLLVNAPDKPDYRFIEANERPGLANHEPAPTAEAFIDFLFPQTKSHSPSETARA